MGEALIPLKDRVLKISMGNIATTTTVVIIEVIIPPMEITLKIPLKREKIPLTIKVVNQPERCVEKLAMLPKINGIIQLKSARSGCKLCEITIRQINTKTGS